MTDAQMISFLLFPLGGLALGLATLWLTRRTG